MFILSFANVLYTKGEIYLMLERNSSVAEYPCIVVYLVQFTEMRLQQFEVDIDKSHVCMHINITVTWNLLVVTMWNETYIFAK